MWRLLGIFGLVLIFAMVLASCDQLIDSPAGDGNQAGGDQTTDPPD